MDATWLGLASLRAWMSTRQSSKAEIPTLNTWTRPGSVYHWTRRHSVCRHVVFDTIGTHVLCQCPPGCDEVRSKSVTILSPTPGLTQLLRADSKLQGPLPPNRFPTRLQASLAGWYFVPGRSFGDRTLEYFRFLDHMADPEQLLDMSAQPRMTFMILLRDGWLSRSLFSNSLLQIQSVLSAQKFHEGCGSDICTQPLIQVLWSF